MNAPVLTYQFETEASHAFPDLASVRVLRTVTTDEGEEVTEGTCGTVIAIYADGAAYEVVADALEHRRVKVGDRAHARPPWASWRATAS